MAAFPTLSPSSRTFTPGEYPHSPFTAWSGRQNRVRLSNVMLSSQLQLSFLAISEAEMLSILAHYRGQVGGFSSFPLPADVLSGVTTAGDFTLSSYGWVYAEPPSVEDLPCGGHNVSLSLVSVPPEGTALIGLNALVRVQFAAGSASAGSSAQLTVAVTLAPGSAGLPGLDQSVTVTLAAGTATSGVSVAGLSRVVFVSLANSVSQSAFGLQSTVTVSLAGGTATSVETDPSFSSVSLLLHMNGSNGSTTFTDSSSFARTITAVGNAQISTAQSKFGGASGLLDGTGDRLTMADATALEFTGDFTAELFVYATTTDDDILLGHSSQNVQLFRINQSGTGKIGVFLNGTQVFIATSAGITINTWHHLALCRSGSSTRLFVDGSQIGSTNTSWTGSFKVNVVGTTWFGFYGNEFTGHLDEIRLTKGVARYTSNFTPPSAPFPDS